MYLKNRREMALFLNERMNRTYESLKDKLKLEHESSLAKTYLLEAHVGDDESRETLHEFVNSRIDIAARYYNFEAKIRTTEEEGFYYGELRIRRDTVVSVYIDATDRRFWRVHSMDKSTFLDNIIDKITTANIDIDRAWLPIQLLEKISERGLFCGLGLDFDRRPISENDMDINDSPVHYLKMQLWGNRASQVLDILRSEKAFPHETTLSKIKVKYWANEKDQNEFSLDDIKFNGKITARGTSFQSHITLVSDLYRKYEEKIKGIEKDYSISYKKHEGAKEGYAVGGFPICIYFCKPIEKLNKFCEVIFSSSYPFRLWGVPVRLSENYFRISAFDLHIGKPINFEISSEYMRIYLPIGSCGNSIMRIFTNLQHYFDPQIEALLKEGKPAFEF